MTKITNFHILFDKSDNNHDVRQQIENNSDKIAGVSRIVDAGMLLPFMFFFSFPFVVPSFEPFYLRNSLVKSVDCEDKCDGIEYWNQRKRTAQGQACK